MNKQELRTYWKSLNIVFGAIFLGVLLFFVVANFVMLDAIARIEDQTTTFILGIVSIAFVLIDFMVIGIVADKIKLNTAETGNLVLDKLNEYRSRVVIKLVMMETSIFAAIIIYIFVQKCK